MLVMIDLDNIVLGVDISAGPQSLSFIDGFDRMLERLGKIAPIAKVMVYGPPETLNRHMGWLKRLRDVTIVQCDKVITKNSIEGKKEDTVDRNMINDGKFFLAEMPRIGHLCLWTGDQDFVELAREAKMQGREVVIVAASEKSLSHELAKFACKGPDGQKAVYIFSPMVQFSF